MREISDSELRAALEAALAIPRFVDDVAGRAPYRDFDDLASAAAEAGSALTPAEIDEAMAGHPRIGEEPAGRGAAQQFSRAEQAAPDADDAVLAAALADANRAYERRFDRVFLIRAAGRSRAEILAELDRRLGLDDDTELAIVADQLLQIALLRLAKTFGGDVA